MILFIFFVSGIASFFLGTCFGVYSAYKSIVKHQTFSWYGKVYDIVEIDQNHPVLYGKLRKDMDDFSKSKPIKFESGIDTKLSKVKGK